LPATVHDSPNRGVIMTQPKLNVTYSPPDPSLLPPWASLPAVFLEQLHRRGLVEELERRIRIERKADACGPVEVVAFLISYFASGLLCGLKPFWYRMRDWSEARGRTKLPSVQAQLASLVGKSKMCSSTSASGALAAVDMALIRPSVEWLLVDLPDMVPLLQHPAVLMRDTFGRGVHVFDLDASITTLLFRIFAPPGEDMPSGKRRATKLGAAGYSGRKRADSQFARAILSHAGAGAWLHSELGRGNGNIREDLVRALKAIVSIMVRIGVTLDLALLRLDGAYGNVPAMTAAIEHGVPFVTRASQAILSMPEVQIRLAAARWEFVPGAEAADMRSVAELGEITLEPGDDTVRDDGTRYAPIKVRAVVSRIRQSGDARRGVVIDGWQYEVFLTTLEADAWPAAEVVAVYNGRSTCENRYAQEDRELGLDHVFSFHPDGQAFATLIGMAVWNMQIARGFLMSPPPAVTPAPTPRIASTDDRPSTFPEAGTSLCSASDEASPGVTASEPATVSADRSSSSDTVSPTSLPDRNSGAGPRDQVASSPPPDEPGFGTPPSSVPQIREALRLTLQQVPWATVLANRPNWTWDDDAGCLRCPDGQHLYPARIRPEERANGDAAAYFATRSGTCRDCDLSDQCFSAQATKMRKQVSLTIPAEVGANIHALLEALPKGRPAAPRTVAPVPSPPPRPPSPPRGGHQLHPLQDVPTTGSWAIVHPLFLPAAARRLVRQLADRIQFEIKVELPDLSPRQRHPLVASNAREKRHGRSTRTERRARHALPAEACICLVARASRAAAEKLLGRRPRKTETA
jgi:hypothetical protein